MLLERKSVLYFTHLLVVIYHFLFVVNNTYIHTYILLRCNLMHLQNMGCVPRHFAPYCLGSKPTTLNAGQCTERKKQAHY